MRGEASQEPHIANLSEDSPTAGRITPCHAHRRDIILAFKQNCNNGLRSALGAVRRPVAADRPPNRVQGPQNVFKIDLEPSPSRAMFTRTAG